MVRCEATHQDYPRVGGEEFGVELLAESFEGLPPRGRGRGDVAGDVSVAVGITPAWAGKSSAMRRAPSKPGDYPRVGGEEGLALGEVGLGAGLPPRGRGRARTLAPFAANPRITPAWAGKR